MAVATGSSSFYADFRVLFPQELPLTALLAREWLLCAERGVAGHNFQIGVRGVIHPWDGIPAGGSKSSG